MHSREPEAATIYRSGKVETAELIGFREENGGYPRNVDKEWWKPTYR